MAKFNTSTARARNGEGVIKTTGEKAVNHKGTVGFLRDEKSELFLSCVSDFVENSFHESSRDRQERVKTLISKIVKTDPEWLEAFTAWLRNGAQMRSISLVVALETADALRKEGISGGRKIVTSALSRADEPGEALAYWMSQKGRKIPAAVKRGISDAAVKLFNEYSVAKYNSGKAGFSLADVIRLTHPSPKDLHQEVLFKHVIERDFDSSTAVPEELTKLTERKRLMSLPKDDLRNLVRSKDGSEVLKNAGLTWEAVAGSIGLDAKTWEALIPNMGYMALLRNLRNFEKEGVSDAVLDEVARRLADPEEVAKSRQLPFRFLSAYNAVSGIEYDSWYGSKKTGNGSLRFVYPLEKALNHSLSNVPALKGKTLILVDRSGSMFGLAGKNGLNLADSAAIFGTALAIRSEDAKLVQYGTSDNVVNFSKSSSVLKTLESFQSMGGTNTFGTLSKHYDKSFDRVIILTDEQYDHSGRGGYSYYRETPRDIVDKNTPFYVWNLGGYRVSQQENKPNRYSFGGLNDQSFKMISLLEQGADAAWPWEA